ncbi:MAG TPA: hypothetical protein VI356_05740 [Myxococcales bacterium]
MKKGKLVTSTSAMLPVAVPVCKGPTVSLAAWWQAKSAMAAPREIEPAREAQRVVLRTSRKATKRITIRMRNFIGHLATDRHFRQTGGEIHFVADDRVKDSNNAFVTVDVYRKN